MWIIYGYTWEENPQIFLDDEYKSGHWRHSSCRSSLLGKAALGTRPAQASAYCVWFPENKTDRPLWSFFVMVVVIINILIWIKGRWPTTTVPTICPIITVQFCVLAMYVVSNCGLLPQFTVINHVRALPNKMNRDSLTLTKVGWIYDISMLMQDTVSTSHMFGAKERAMLSSSASASSEASQTGCCF